MSNNNNQFTNATNLNQVMKPSSNFYSNINELNNQDKEEYTNNKFTSYIYKHAYIYSYTCVYIL